MNGSSQGGLSPSLHSCFYSAFESRMRTLTTRTCEKNSKTKASV